MSGSKSKQVYKVSVDPLDCPCERVGCPGWGTCHNPGCNNETPPSRNRNLSTGVMRGEPMLYCCNLCAGRANNFRGNSPYGRRSKYG